MHEVTCELCGNPILKNGEEPYSGTEKYCVCKHCIDIIIKDYGDRIHDILDKQEEYPEKKRYIVTCVLPDETTHKFSVAAYTEENCKFIWSKCMPGKYRIISIQEE